jgi:hypothetical protein
VTIYETYDLLAESWVSAQMSQEQLMSLKKLMATEATQSIVVYMAGEIKNFDGRLDIIKVVQSDGKHSSVDVVAHVGQSPAGCARYGVISSPFVVAVIDRPRGDRPFYGGYESTWISNACSGAK